jgi:hypothetical protein
MCDLKRALCIDTEPKTPQLYEHTSLQIVHELDHHSIVLLPHSSLKKESSPDDLALKTDFGKYTVTSANPTSDTPITVDNSPSNKGGNIQAEIKYCDNSTQPLNVPMNDITQGIVILHPDGMTFRRRKNSGKSAHTHMYTVTTTYSTVLGKPYFRIKITTQQHYNAFENLGIWGLHIMEFATFYVDIRTN